MRGAGCGAYGGPDRPGYALHGVRTGAVRLRDCRAPAGGRGDHGPDRLALRVAHSAGAIGGNRRRTRGDHLQRPV